MKIKEILTELSVGAASPVGSVPSKKKKKPTRKDLALQKLRQIQKK